MARGPRATGRQPWEWSIATCSRSTRGACAMHVQWCVRGACARAAQRTRTVAARHTAQAGAVGLELVQPQHGPRARAPSARCDGARARPATALPPARALCAARAHCRAAGRAAGRSDGVVAAGCAPHGLCSAVALP